MTWQDYERQCLEEYDLTCKASTLVAVLAGISYAFAFIAKHFPEAAACMAAGEMRRTLSDVLSNCGCSDSNDIQCANCERCEAALAACEAGKEKA